MRAVVTGAAGFIGSSLCDRLLNDGYRVLALDSFTDYYPESRKRANLASALKHETFELVEDDLASSDLTAYLVEGDVVFHQAGQPGVRGSWADGFSRYITDNILATQRLLECSRAAKVSKFIYASSSSIYGNDQSYPTTENANPRPTSPYGVTKLAGEQLARLYATEFGLNTVSLRYFTVYGPRQRPDMATQRLIASAISGKPFSLYGDGGQLRDFTFVDDIVAGNLAAASSATAPGDVFNLSGGASVSMMDLISLVGNAVGSPVPVEPHPDQPGDVRRTGGDSSRAREVLNWSPTTTLAEGVARQVAWNLECGPVSRTAPGYGHLTGAAVTPAQNGGFIPRDPPSAHRQ